MKWQDCISNYAALRHACIKLESNIKSDIKQYSYGDGIFRLLNIPDLSMPPMPSKGKSKDDMWHAAHKANLALQDFAVKIGQMKGSCVGLTESKIEELQGFLSKCQTIGAKSLNIIKQYFIEYNHADSLLKAIAMESDTQPTSEYVNSPIDPIDNTMIIKAAKHSSAKVIDMLLEKGANPFKANKYGESAFSVLLSNHMEEHAKKCLQQFTKASPSSISSQDPEIMLELTKILESNVAPGELEKFIATNICNAQHQEFRGALGYDDRAAQVCFDAALESYKCLGENVKDSDVSALLWCNDLI